MLKLSFFNLFRRKTRTILALLGIIIGVTAIIGLVSVVDGLNKEFENALGQFQGVIIMEKNSFDQTLSKIDVKFEKKLEKIQGVKTVVPEIWHIPTTVNGKAQFGADNVDLFGAIYVLGVDTKKYNSLRGDGWVGNIIKGKKITSNDKGWILLGETAADDKDLFVGSSIKINGKKFRIKGIFQAGTDLWETMALMNIDDAKEISDFGDEFFSDFYIELDDPTQDKKVSKLINFQHGTEIEASSASGFSEQYSPIMDNLRVMVFFIAALSAIVAGVGIANTIFMSVLDRTKEIGSLKAVGWNNTQIIKMIMYEAMFLGIIGGIIGIVIGIGAAGFLENAIGIGTFVSVELLLQAFLFALFVGLISGIYPAIKASQLNPVEAIRSG